MALTVVEPTSNGIGSDAFALVWAGGGLHGLNASGRSPMAFDPAPFAGEERIPFYGWGGVTTPGCVSGWAELASRFGTLPMTTLAEPAVRYAREGFMVSPEIAHYWARAAERYTGPEFEPWRRTFAPAGRAPRTGEVFRSEPHAHTLEQIAQTDGAAFYRGDLADRIDAYARAGGGALRKADLEAHEADWVRPISIEYHGHRLHEIPPNGQGLVALIALGLLDRFDLPDLEVDSAAWLHLQIEAMKLAFADGHRYIADPRTMDARVEDLLSDAYLDERAALIDRERAQDFGHGTPKPGGTIYLTAADSDGNMVSFIQSNYTGFGSGMVVPDTGIALQNRACCFSLEPGHPNAAAPNKRPYHTIIPGFVTKTDDAGNERALMSFGVMGGFMQPQGHAQVLVRIADHEQNPQAALDAPRWQVTEGLGVMIEPGFDRGVYETLAGMGHDLTYEFKRSARFGRGQIIYALDDGYVCGSELRADGQAVGF
jgi:gamma-glutamyltranspeptidase/glutathione hydrolase